MEEKKIKIEIKNRFTGKILFEYEKVGNTIKDTVIKAVESGANLCGADLCGANLCGADLCGAYLCDANLCGAYLRGAYLRDAYLCGAYLRGANLCGAYLRGAYLRDAYLRDANLGGAKEVPYIPMACPTDGAFIGWKKVLSNGLQYLVKLLIPDGARRSSATGRKCRCDKAVVQEIRIIQDGKVREDVVEVKVVNLAYDQETVYEVGMDVLPDSWDDDRFNECSHGIHFFIDKQEAIDY